MLELQRPEHCRLLMELMDLGAVQGPPLWLQTNLSVASLEGVIGAHLPCTEPAVPIAAKDHGFRDASLRGGTLTSREGALLAGYHMPWQCNGALRAPVPPSTFLSGDVPLAWVR